MTTLRVRYIARLATMMPSHSYGLIPRAARRQRARPPHCATGARHSPRHTGHTAACPVCEESSEDFVDQRPVKTTHTCINSIEYTDDGMRARRARTATVSQSQLLLLSRQDRQPIFIGGASQRKGYHQRGGLRRGNPVALGCGM